MSDFKSERVAVELFRTLDVVEKMVDEGIRTPGLLIANGESLKLRRVATIS